MDVKEQDILGRAIDEHWYYVCKNRALLQFLRGHSANELLDVGAGSGFFAKQLLDAGICDRAICVDTAYTGDHIESRGGKPLAFVRAVPEARQDLILMMDVIEHVDDDVAFLRQYTGHMPRNGRAVVTVPAFQFLWSGHDVFLEHRRRYTLESLSRSLDAAGLEIVRARYFFSALFPLICALRLWGRLQLTSPDFAPRSDLRVHAPLVNAVLIAIHEAERHTLFPFNRLAGLTIFCLAKRR